MDQCNDDQPLDFSRKAPTPSGKRTPQQQQSSQQQRASVEHHVRSWAGVQEGRSEPSHLTTPSPSPPESSKPSPQVLCQLLSNSMFGNAMKQHHRSQSKSNQRHSSHHYDDDESHDEGPLTPTSGHALEAMGMGGPSPITSSPNHSPTVTQATNGRGPRDGVNGSEQALNSIGLSLANLHATHSPSAQASSAGVDRFGTSGGLLTTAMAPTAVASAVAAERNRNAKYTRPFKAYPRELPMPMNYLNYGLPLQLPLTPDALATQSLLASASDQQYLQFREQMLQQKQRTQQEPRKKSTGSVNSEPMSSPPPPQLSMSQVKNELQMAHMQQAQQTPSGPNLSDENSQLSNGATSSGGESDNGMSQNTPRSMTPYGTTMGSLSARETGSGGGGSGSRKRGRPLPDEQKDDAYWERRRKNNEAAKRSRDARRAKEDEIAIRAAFLEQENLKLRVEVAGLKTETAKLRCLLYQQQ
ncbi:Cell death specification protein 2 [Halotydeus destructor]|nr:Cell death specification protein 2 [Halotydeus destructor]